MVDETSDEGASDYKVFVLGSRCASSYIIPVTDVLLILSYAWRIVHHDSNIRWVDRSQAPLGAAALQD